MNRTALQSTLAFMLASAGLNGCVGGKTSAKDAEPSLEIAPEQYQAELNLAFADEVWRQQIDSEISQVENATDAFIQSASDIYDLLIDANDALIQQRITQIDDRIKQSLARRAAMVAALAHLLERLEQDDIKTAVGKLPAGAQEYREVCEGLRQFRASDSKVVSYRQIKGRLMEAIAFGELSRIDAAITKLEPAHRDALALLDYLRITSNTVANLSGIMTQWVVHTNPDQHPQSLTIESLSH